MNRDIAEKWIADLRTNPPQANGKLYDGKGHCCLGRLCVLAGIEPKYDGEYDRYEFLGDAHSLPPQVIEWAGMKTEDGIYNYHDGQDDADDDKGVDCLARDNDNGETFDVIADIIAAHIDEL